MRRTWCSGPASIQRRPAGPPTSPAWSSPARWWRSGGRSRSSPPATGSWPWSAAGRRPPWPSSTRRTRWPCPTACPGPRPAASPRCSPPPTTPSSARPSCRWASACWSAAARVASGRPGVQLAAQAGATVTATVRDPARHDAVAALGADVVLAPGDEAASAPYDVVLELVGAPSLTNVLPHVAPWGRVVVIGVGGGGRMELELMHAHAEAGPHRRLHPAHPQPAREGRGGGRRRCPRAAGAGGGPPADPGVRDVPACPRPRPPTTASEPAPSSARWSSSRRDP